MIGELNMTRTRTIAIPYDVYEGFAAYIEYGDIDGLEQSEVEAFEALTAKARADAKRGYEFMHWTAQDNGDEDYGFCEAIDVFCKLVRINAVYRKA